MYFNPLFSLSPTSFAYCSMSRDVMLLLSGKIKMFFFNPFFALSFTSLALKMISIITQMKSVNIDYSTTNNIIVKISMALLNNKLCICMYLTCQLHQQQKSLLIRCLLIYKENKGPLMFCIVRLHYINVFIAMTHIL